MEDGWPPTTQSSSSLAPQTPAQPGHEPFMAPGSYPLPVAPPKVSSAHPQPPPESHNFSQTPAHGAGPSYVPPAFPYSNLQEPQYQEYTPAPDTGLTPHFQSVLTSVIDGESSASLPDPSSQSYFTQASHGSLQGFNPAYPQFVSQGVSQADSGAVPTPPELPVPPGYASSFLSFNSPAASMPMPPSQPSNVTVPPSSQPLQHAAFMHSSRDSAYAPYAFPSLSPGPHSAPLYRDYPTTAPHAAFADWRTMSAPSAGREPDFWAPGDPNAMSQRHPVQMQQMMGSPAFANSPVASNSSRDTVQHASTDAAVDGFPEAAKPLALPKSSAVRRASSPAPPFQVQKKLSTPPDSKTPSSAPTRVPKSTQDVLVSCMDCSTTILRLYKRGTQPQLEYPCEHQFRCKDCAADKLGSQLERQGNTRKRSRAGYSPVNSVVCDVCRRIVARGGLSWASDEDSELKRRFDAEYTCVECDRKYQKCSDCGGGGGRRGAGKWRAKEMFDGRKTCILSHTRTASATDTEHQTIDIESLTQDERDYYWHACGQLFRTNLLANLAVPEMMENSSRSATPIDTFAAIQEMCDTGWCQIGSLLYSSPAGVKVKGLISIRLGRQQRRKAINRSNSAKELVGFSLMEYEYDIGHIFTRIVCPWSTGDGFDASNRMIEDAMGRAWQVRSSLVADLQSQGFSSYEAYRAVPEPNTTWTMLFLARESRIISWMERRRNFTVLATFLEENPDKDPKHFPPYRPIYMPPKQQEGWTILARRIGPDSASG